MKRSSLFFLSLILASTSVLAQYNYAIGFRTGGTTGISVKKILNQSSIEGIAGFWSDGLSITTLYEKQQGTPGKLNWIYGAGVHATFYADNLRDNAFPAWYADHPGDIDDGAVGFGVDVMAGLEFFFRAIPLAFSFEIKPFIEFTTSENIWLSLDPGFGIKVIF
jgi:hypothetical protein